MTDFIFRHSVLHRRLIVLCLLSVMCALLSGLSWAGLVFSSDTTERRVKISLSIFPRIIVVDNKFSDKVAEHNIVNLAFVYDKDRSRAMDLRKLFLKKSQAIAGLALVVEPVSVDDLSANGMHSFTALFVTERIGVQQFGKLLEYAVEHQLILFSPFSGDVERGATAGISVTSRVRPFFNTGTLHRSDIEINPLLMDMSKRHE